MEMKRWKMVFLESALLGQSTDKSNPNDVFSKCVDLAYKDMMTAGRYYSSLFMNKKEDICISAMKAIMNDNCEFSENLISKVALLFAQDEIIGSGNKYVTRYGLAQKLVNMTFKYLYIFSDYIFVDGTTPCFSNCDCPLDSIILRKANIKDCVWSKLSSLHYAQCQTIISSILETQKLDVELTSLGNLAFDFLNW